MVNVSVRPASAEDAEALAGIYNHYVQNTVVTFEEEAVSAEAMAARVADLQRASLPWLVAGLEKEVVGYAYATRWRERSAYRHSVETTIYLAEGRAGGGLGTRLYSELLATLKARGLHVAIGGIALPNEASVALHRKLGFEPVALFREVGFKHGRWVDVAYWQRVL